MSEEKIVDNIDNPDSGENSYELSSNEKKVAEAKNELTNILDSETIDLEDLGITYNFGREAVFLRTFFVSVQKHTQFPILLKELITRINDGMPKKKKDHHLQILSQLIFDLRKKNYMTLSEGETVYRIISQYVELGKPVDEQRDLIGTESSNSGVGVIEIVKNTPESMAFLQQVCPDKAEKMKIGDHFMVMHMGPLAKFDSQSKRNTFIRALYSWYLTMVYKYALSLKSSYGIKYIIGCSYLVKNFFQSDEIYHMSEEMQHNTSLYRTIIQEGKYHETEEYWLKQEIDKENDHKKKNELEDKYHEYQSYRKMIDKGLEIMLGVKDAANMFDDIERQLYREIRRIRKDLD